MKYETLKLTQFVKRNPLVSSIRLACLAAIGLLSGASVQAQGEIAADHLYAGAVGTGYGDQLIWSNGGLFSTNSGNYYKMLFSSSGEWAGYFNSEPTMAVLAATADFGGPVSNAPALGAFIQVKISLVVAPDGGLFGFWEPDATSPTHSLGLGDTSSLIPLSGGDENPDAGTFGVDPYGHIDDRRFTATLPGDYIVGFQLFDTSDNGLDGLPIHSASDILYVDFRALTAVPEPGTNALIGLGLVAFWLGARKRMRSPRASSPPASDHISAMPKL